MYSRAVSRRPQISVDRAFTQGWLPSCRQDLPRTHEITQTWCRSPNYKKGPAERRQSGAIKSSNSLHSLFTLQTFVKVPLTEASHLTYFISSNLYSHTWRSVLLVQLCRPGVWGSEKLHDLLGVTWLQNKSWNQALEACPFQMPPPCHTWLNPSALMLLNATVIALQHTAEPLDKDPTFLFSGWRPRWE